MLVTATEFKTNFGRYLDTVTREDIYVSRKGKVIAKISSPANEKLAMLDSIVGIAGGMDISLSDARNERLSEK
jgi:antitoxin (DNA-binding transcriptional repressor) of toxin-antitoxin stability system